MKLAYWKLKKYMLELMIKLDWANHLTAFVMSLVWTVIATAIITVMILIGIVPDHGALFLMKFQVVNILVAYLTFLSLMKD